MSVHWATGRVYDCPDKVSECLKDPIDFMEFLLTTPADHVPVELAGVVEEIQDIYGRAIDLFEAAGVVTQEML